MVLEDRVFSLTMQREEARATTVSNTCHITASNPCPISSMPHDEMSLVYPGGDTACISETTGPFSFMVIPGDVDKLLFYFQGGGACWDWASTAAEMCTMTANPDGPNGVFDRTRTDNPFNNYTIVEVLYCSGDVFLGNVTQKWKTPYGDEAKQVGQLNTMATVQWLRTQLGYDTKSTPSPLASLVISGDSAGSMGAQIWSGALLELFPADYAAVVPDSFVGYFPKGTQESILKDTWPPCAGPMADFVSEAVCQQAAAGQMNLQLWMASVVKAWPTVPFAWVQAKEDVIQIEFYSAIAATFFQDPILLPEQLYAGANEILLGYDTYPNTLHYIIDDGFHTYTELPRFYTADTTGPLGGGKVQPLLQWVQGLAASPPGASNKCDGQLLNETQWGKGVAYCALEMANKTFSSPMLNGL